MRKRYHLELEQPKILLHKRFAVLVSPTVKRSDLDRIIGMCSELLKSTTSVPTMFGFSTALIMSRAYTIISLSFINMLRTIRDNTSEVMMARIQLQKMNSDHA